MKKPHGRKKVVVALASAALAVATGWISVGVIGSASAAEGDRHPLVIQRVYGDDGQTLVESVIFSDNDTSDRWCINLHGDLNSWTDADADVRVRENHKYKVLGYHTRDCEDGAMGQPGSPNVVPPIGMTTVKFWYTPNFIR